MRIFTRQQFELAFSRNVIIRPILFDSVGFNSKLKTDFQARIVCALDQ